MTPKVRLPEFTDELHRAPFGSVARRIVEKNKERETNVLTISSELGLVNQLEYFNHSYASKDLSNYTVLRRGDFAYNKSYSAGYPMGAIKRLNNYKTGIVSPLYICFRIKEDNDPRYFEQYFESGIFNKEIGKIAQEGARNHGLLNMSIVDFFEFPTLTIHSNVEQQKIADFLTAVDERIDLNEQKLALLQKYKRAVMQKIFSQEVRFKDENGEDYPEWRETRIRDFLVERKTYASKDGKYEHISLTTNGVVPKSERYERDFLVGSADKKYRITRIDDICYNPANLKFGVIARNKYKTGIFSPIYVTYEVRNADVGFVEYMVTRKDFIQQARKFEEGTVYERMAVNPNDMANLIVMMPIKEEQQKIANFLTALDDKIEIEKSKLIAACQFKKALLQRMFV